MFCPHCGTVVADDAKFCHKCGDPVPSIEQESIVAPAREDKRPVDVIAKTIEAPESKPPRPIAPLAPSKRQIAVSILLAVFLALMYGFAISDALNGIFKAEKNAGGFVSLTALAFWYFWRIMNRNAWVGACVGAAVSLILVFLCSGISGYFKGHTYL